MQSLLPKRFGKRSRGWIGLAFDAAGAAVLRLEPGAPLSVPRLTAATFIPAEQTDQLAAWVKQQGVTKWPAWAVLAAGEAPEFQITAPDVPAAERCQAAQWQVREVLDYPVTQAVVDCFAPPAPSQRGEDRLNVVVARRTDIAARINQISQARLTLEVLDIPDLAQRNLSLCLREAAPDHALLALDESQGLLTICRGEDLYLARWLSMGIPTHPAMLDSLLLEVQRSLDYFEGTLGQPPIGKIYVHAGTEDDLVSSLREQLGSVSWQPLALTDLLEVNGPDLANLPQRALILRALGAALRPDGQGASCS